MFGFDRDARSDEGADLDSGWTPGARKGSLEYKIGTNHSTYMVVLGRRKVQAFPSSAKNYTSLEGKNNMNMMFNKAASGGFF